MQEHLSADASRLLYLMCCYYRSRVISGTESCNAAYMGSSERIASQLKPGMSLRTVDLACRDLDKAGYLRAYCDAGCVYSSSLTSKALACVWGSPAMHHSQDIQAI